MKKLLVVALLLAIFLQPATGQQEYTILLPLLRGGTMSDWKIIVPEATTNYCLNPSAEIAGNNGAVGGGTQTLVNTAQFFDVYSYRIQTAANDQGGSFTLQALSNNIHYVTMRVSGTLPAAWDWSLDDAAYTAPVLLEAIDAVWSLYGLVFPAAQATGSVLLLVRQNGAGAGDFNIDGIQVEQKTYWTTYCDGTRQGCEWNAAAHASASQRSAVSRAGGLVQDLQDDYAFEIGGMIATGMPPIMNAVDSYAILPGGELNSIKVESRVFTLTGVIRGTTLANLHANRQALLNVLKPNAVPEDAEGPQPVRLRYIGAAVQKQISVHYEAGLEIRIEARMECWERLAIRFLADDPYWYEIGDSADVLVSSDGATLRYVAGRLRSTGQWDDLGLTADPGAGGTVYDIAIGPDKRIYFAGDFTNWNTAGTGMDYMAVYDPIAGTWSPLGPANAINGIVYTMAFAANGDIYVGGEFTDLGNGNGDYIAMWDVSASTWTNVGIPNQGTAAIARVWKLIFGLDGTLYVGGSFTDLANMGAADYIASWDGANYAVLGLGFNAVVFSLAIALDGTLFAGGGFTFSGAIPINRLAQWDGATWSVAYSNTGFNSGVEALAVGGDGTIYAGGTFVSVDGVTIRYIVEGDGLVWSQLGGGLTSNGANSRVDDIAIGADGMVYAIGRFTAVNVAIADDVGKWNGASWAYLDVDLPGAPTGWAIAVNAPDPVVIRNYDVFLGFTTTGAGVFAGDVTITNAGTERSFPKIVVSRTGGTGATLEEIRNETSGLELLFDYDLLDGETITIDLAPTKKSIVSSMFGSRLDAVLANSDFGTFVLQPGNNLVTAFVVTDATVVAFIQWDDKYWSQD